MKIINASYKIMNPDITKSEIVEDIYRRIENAGRTCYKSENRTRSNSFDSFIRMCIQKGHESVLEHASLTVKFIVDRGVSHELVRHRIASFSQESTRYCNYSDERFGNEVTFIKPCFWDENEDASYAEWETQMREAEKCYLHLLAIGEPPQHARSVLPNSLKTEVIMTANIREWRDFLKKRAAGIYGVPHPQMAEVAIPLLKELRLRLPILFEDIIPMEV